MTTRRSPSSRLKSGTFASMSPTDGSKFQPSPGFCLKCQTYSPVFASRATTELVNSSSPAPATRAIGFIGAAPPTPM